MREKRITYLLGAGASANCLPVVNEINTRLERIKQTIEGFLQPQDNILISPKKFYEKSLIKKGAEIVNDVAWLLYELQNHYTIDTLARRFYLNSNRHQDLMRLKKILYFFFLYEQGIKEGKIRQTKDKELPDMRYDNFISTLMSDEIDKLELPSNVNIITWNYDIQFELAYQVYDDSEVYKIQEKLNVFPDFNKTRIYDESQFSIVHLNGIIYPIPEWKKFENIVGLPHHKFDESYQKYLELICHNYSAISEDFLKRLNFSWEDSEKYMLTDNSRNSCIDIAKKIISKTDVLIVIGYSFPQFNRAIDNEILSMLNNSVESIYIQDTPERVDNLVREFNDSFSSTIRLNKGLLENRVKAISSVNSFYIPSSLTIK